jgi:nitronate monooxygenase
VEQIQRLHEAGIFVIGTITHADEALAWESRGADAVIASGVEAGGHRGTFIGAQEDAKLTTFELLPAVVAAVDIPVIAAGGIMDGADIKRALNGGAQAVQMGTAFLVTDESSINPAYKQRC